VVYHPADLAPFPARDVLAVMVWGNGGCAIFARLPSRATFDAIERLPVFYGAPSIGVSLRTRPGAAAGVSRSRPTRPPGEVAASRRLGKLFALQPHV